jgi:hypothetical protein
MRIDINNSPVYWRGGAFFPEGAFQVYGEIPPANNPKKWQESGATWAARIIVGFKRQGKRQVTMNQLVRIVRRMRQEQVGNPSSTFLSQRGLYRHSDTGEVVDEPGAQVILINLSAFKTSSGEFEEQVEAIAEAIVEELEQNEVIVEIQRNGMIKKTFGIGRVK